MLFPDKIEEKIGFNEIRSTLKTLCISQVGADLVSKIHFEDNYEKLSSIHRELTELVLLHEDGERLPLREFPPLEKELARLQMNNAVLYEEELFAFLGMLKVLSSCLFYVVDNSTKLTELAVLAKEIALDHSIITHIESILDERGHVRSNASPELARIRVDITKEEARLRQKLQKSLEKAKKDKMVEEDAQLTVKNGRMVIPVQSEYKRRIKGLIHDESSTGQTTYLEPFEVFENNNLVKELYQRERREIIRILSEATEDLRDQLEELIKGIRFLAKLDVTRAKMHYAEKIGGCLPSLQNTPLIKWKNAQHPLLKKKMEEKGEKIVPYDLDIYPDQRIIVISGPNAGGKSVCLKTVALVQYMIQCGIPVPVDFDESEAGMFHDIFIDIGDEQSMDSDLSTYSAHLSYMKYFLQYSGKKTLFLIDEFGTGTDPEFGGAIAEAILEKLYEANAYGVITTHYSNLKTFAANHPRVINAAMAFNVKDLEPLYKLVMGKPGASFAYELATKMDLPQEVITSSQSKMGAEKVEYEKLLSELQRENERLEKQNAKLIKAQEELEGATREYKDVSEFLKRKKKELLDEAKREANHIIKDANKLIENTIREIKESNADKSKAKNLRKGLEEFKGKIKVEDKPQQTFEAIKEGDWVTLKNGGNRGQVTQIKGDKLEVIVGQLKLRVKKEDIDLSSLQPEKSKSTFKVSRSKKLNFSPNKDMRGKRVEEVIPELDRFLNDALLAAEDRLTILHGKGSGALKKHVREYLNTLDFVDRYESEHADRGGEGITIVYLK